MTAPTNGWPTIARRTLAAHRHTARPVRYGLPMTPLGRVLGVGPRTDDDTDRWIVTISIEGNPPQVTVLEPVSSYTEAIDRAEAHTCSRVVFIGSTLSEIAAAGVGGPLVDSHR